MSTRHRLAWFSPMPPVRSGVATCSGELVPILSRSYDIDVFVDAVAGSRSTGARSAHDFLWLHAQSPYDLTVYQLGNSSAHDYIWPYLFRFPGLTVLHDARLHHARAALLLRSERETDYRREFALNHPDAHPDVAELVIAGLDNHIYYHWPMTRLVVQRSRVTAVHAAPIARELCAQVPDATIESIHLGHGRAVSDEEAATARTELRALHAIQDEAVVFGCFGGLSPEKRLPQILAVFSTLRSQLPSARLLLGGAAPAHYDLEADIARAGLAESVITTGYLESDEQLTRYIAACDVALNLRWPTAREISGPWLRCLAAGKATIVIDLAHLAGVPALDPRSWRCNLTIPGSNGTAAEPPVCVAVDILDEGPSLLAAMRRLGRDKALRDAVGRAGQTYWRAHHTPELMADDYRRVIARAMSRPASTRDALEGWPAHLTGAGDATLKQVLEGFGISMETLNFER